MINPKIKQDSTLYNNYLEVLKSRTFKILPLLEESNVGVFQYIKSLANELYGLQYVIENLDNDHLLISLISTLESFADISIEAEYDFVFIRSEIFKCITIITKMKGE
jgi:hypothetical protein